MKIMKVSIKLLFIVPVLFLSISCQKEASRTTGWNYNDPKMGGFEVAPFSEQITGPGLVFIEGGTFVRGRMEEDVMKDWNNTAMRTHVNSFYMDESEISNIDYLEYLHWLNKVFSSEYPIVYKKALPDTLVWRDKLGFNEEYVEYYLRYPAYRYYPVVGVSWKQASDYASWRTDRVNEIILAQQGVITLPEAPGPFDYFNTKAYLLQGADGSGVTTNPKGQFITPNGETRDVRLEDGIMLPEYRLPTEVEWEFAAYGLIGNTIGERIYERKLYPWNGHTVRTDLSKSMGDFIANTRRGRGDYMGIAGNLNDGASATAPVISYWPNDYGLFNMGGNVSEWVMDVYRQLSNEDIAEFNGFRGNYFTEYIQTGDEENPYPDRTDPAVYENLINDPNSIYYNNPSVIGKVPMQPVDQTKNDRRRNYRSADNINYLDGDFASSKHLWKENAAKDSSNIPIPMYERNVNKDYGYNLVGDRARIYKGASWKDIQYYINPATKRYMDEDESTNYIGFRCAMSRLGTPIQGNK